MIRYLKTHKSRCLAVQPYYDRVIVAGVCHRIVYQIVYYLLKLGDIGVDHDSLIGVKFDDYSIVLLEDIEPGDHAGKPLGQIEHGTVDLGDSCLEL